MGIDALPADLVATRCREGGVEIRDLERLRPLVYRGKLAGGREVAYVKLYEPERGEAVETVVEIGPEIGLPHSSVVRADRFVALVSEEATGRPSPTSSRSHSSPEFGRSHEPTSFPPIVGSESTSRRCTLAANRRMDHCSTRETSRRRSSRASGLRSS
jgi:hypothetical protein